MRRTLVALSFMMLGIYCYARKDDAYHTIGIDIGSAIYRGSLKFHAGRQFATHWSLDGEHELNISLVRHGPDSDEKEHLAGFRDIESTTDMSVRDMVSAEMKIKYWIKEAYNGIHIMAGLKHGDRKGTDFTIGAGYSFFIWKGLSCSLVYETGIRLIQENGLTLKLSYTY